MTNHRGLCLMTGQSVSGQGWTLCAELPLAGAGDGRWLQIRRQGLLTRLLDYGKKENWWDSSSRGDY